MKVYKKEMMRFQINSRGVLLISHPLYSSFFNRSRDAVKINKWSLMHSLNGLEKVLQGSLVYISKENEMKYTNIEEVIMGNRVVAYAKYREYSENRNSSINYILRCLR